MKVFFCASLLVMLVSCASSIKTFCKFNAQNPDNSMFYEDLDFFTMQGIRKTDCATSKAKNEYAFLMSAGSDTVSVVNIKLWYDKEIYHFKRIPGGASTMFVTDVMNRREPGAFNYDTVVKLSPSEMMIHRSMKFINVRYEPHDMYFIWKRKSDTTVDFSKFVVTPGRQLDTTVNDENLQLIHHVAFRIKGDSLHIVRTNYDGPGKRVRKESEKFDSYFRQLFLKSL